MKYLHNTAVKFHGNLTSTRCVIDSHWVVKITDWGLHEFKAGQENTKKHPNKMYTGTFGVCLLDHYVYYNSSSYLWEIECPNISCAGPEAVCELPAWVVESCFWIRHFTLYVSFFTQVYKWVSCVSSRENFLLIRRLSFSNAGSLIPD